MAKASPGQGSLPGEVGLQLSPEGQTEGRGRGVYMGEMESYKAKQAASALEGSEEALTGWWQRRHHEVGPEQGGLHPEGRGGGD